MASVAAWHTTSASEWPSAPRADGDGHAADAQRPALHEPVQVVAGADAGRTRLRRSPRGPRPDRSSVVIFTFPGSPSTTCTGWPARSASVASSVASTPDRPSATASASTSRRNACGVCARKIVSRGIVSTMTRAVRMALDPLDRVVRCERGDRRAVRGGAASIVRSIISALTNGRAASWMSDDLGSTDRRSQTRSPPNPDASRRRRRIVSGRTVAPMYVGASRRAAAPAAARRSRVRRPTDANRTPRRCAPASSGRRPRAAASARAARIRRPAPPAAMMAVTRMFANDDYTDGGGRGTIRFVDAARAICSRTRSATSRTASRDERRRLDRRVNGDGHLARAHHQPALSSSRSGCRRCSAGTIGRPESIASRNEPPLKRATVPSTLRVPSGNTISE